MNSGLINDSVGASAALQTRSAFQDATRTRLAGDDASAIGKGFEEMLLSMLVKEMRQTSGVKMFGEGAGANMFETMFDQFMTQAMVDGGGLGIGEEWATRVLESRAATAGDTAPARISIDA